MVVLVYEGLLDHGNTVSFHLFYCQVLCIIMHPIYIKGRLSPALVSLTYPCRRSRSISQAIVGIVDPQFSRTWGWISPKTPTARPSTMIVAQRPSMNRASSRGARVCSALRK